MTAVGIRIQKYAVLIPLLFFAVLMICLYRQPGISTDGHTYLQIARNIHYGVGLGWQALWFPPLHSILIALVAWLPGVHDIQAAAGIVAILMGMLLTVSLYFLSTEIFNPKVGVLAAITVLAFPHIFNAHISTEAEITYVAFLISSLALLIAAVKRESRILAALTGISFSLAYLARSEGFLIMLMTLAALCASQGSGFYRRPLARLCLITLVLFFATSSPYLLFLKKHYGTFVISPKASYVMIWMKSQVYHDNDKGEIGNDELWGLTPDGTIKWQQPSGLRDLVAYLMSHPAKSLSVYLHNLSLEIPGRIPNSGGTQHFPQVYPIYVALLALLAAVQKWGESSRLKKAVLFAPLLILLVLPVFTGGWHKYLMPYAPLLMIAACGGLFIVFERLKNRTENPYGRLAAFLSPFGVLALMAGYNLSILVHTAPAPVRSDLIARNKDYEYTRNAARTARGLFGPGKNYMVEWNKMIYYLEGLWTPMPITTHDNRIAFARRHNVDYIIQEYAGWEWKNDELLRFKPNGLDLVGFYRSDDGEYIAAYYKLKK
jgi:4-amino-4-deoxy-L-arabinose transferase-like glycosyltransferase